MAAMAEVAIWPATRPPILLDKGRRVGRSFPGRARRNGLRFGGRQRNRPPLFQRPIAARRGTPRSQSGRLHRHGCLCQRNGPYDLLSQCVVTYSRDVAYLVGGEGQLGEVPPASGLAVAAGWSVAGAWFQQRLARLRRQVLQLEILQPLGLQPGRP